jgi:glucose-1-phosphatase
MKRFFLLVAMAASVVACQCTSPSGSRPVVKTEWIARPEAFQEHYTLEQMVVLSRHNIRTPLVSKNSVLTRLTNAEYQWFPWKGESGTLTPRGAQLETKMGTFFSEWLDKKGILSAYGKDAFRFYANAKQRCQATARQFADALLPGKNPPVEMNVPFDTMDPVFNPQITKLSEEFTTQALEEIQELFGNLDAKIATGCTLIERVIDITHSPAYPDTASFSQFPSSVGFKLNAEPFMNGGLKMACTVSDALSLQYYEEADEQKAAFGQQLSFDDWVTVSSVKEWYGDILFNAPSVAVNVAHPLLQEILDEIQNEKRVFTFLCGHDSNLSSVLAALKAELPDLPGSVEKRTPIGGKLIFECFKGVDGNEYADLLLVYASTAQLRAISTLTYDNPPMAVKVTLSGLSANPDGLYRLSDLEQRLSQAIAAYDVL